MQKNINKDDVYDTINTTCVRWLKYLADKYDKPLCIKKFDKKDKTNLWLLEMFRHYSMFSGYCDYYIDTNIFVYLYFKYIKKFKHLKYCSNNLDLEFIDTSKFIEELTTSCHQDINIITEIYDKYYNRR